MLFQILLALSPIIFVTSMSLIMLSIPHIKNLFDVITKGKNDPLHDSAIIALSHLMQNVDEWSFKKEYARYPKNGNMSKILFNKDNGNYYLSIDEINNGIPLKLGPYMSGLFLEEIKKNLDDVAAKAIIKNLYPERLLMIGHESQTRSVSEFTSTCGTISTFKTEYLNEAERVVSKK